MNTYICDKIEIRKNKRIINNTVVILDGGRLGNRKGEKHISNIHQVNVNILVFIMDVRFMSVYYITNK